MDYTGIWKHHKTGEEIRIRNLRDTDDYILEWEKSGRDYNMKQKIHISIGNNNHSHLPFSDRFGEGIMINIDSNTIEINEERFNREAS